MGVESWRSLTSQLHRNRSSVDQDSDHETNHQTLVVGRWQRDSVIVELLDLLR